MPTLTAGQSKTLTMAPGWVVAVSAPANAVASVVDTQSNQARTSPIGPVAYSKTFGPYDAGATVVIANTATSGASLTYTLSAVAKGPMQLTWSERPDATLNAGAELFFTDVGIGNQFQAYGGTSNRWKPTNGNCLLDSIDTANTGAAQTAAQDLNPNRRLIPAGVIAGTDRMTAEGYLLKSGTTDTYTFTLRIGSGAGTANTILHTFTLAAASRAGHFRVNLKRTSATTLRVETLTLASNGFGTMTAESVTAAAAAVTVENLDSVSQYIGLVVVSSGITDTSTIQDYTFNLYSTDS